MITQEKKFYTKLMKPMNIEELRSNAKRIEPNNRIELEFQRDILKTFSNMSEEELYQCKNETGIFYFWNDYSKKEK